mgnify:CR=1 FL=1
MAKKIESPCVSICKLKDDLCIGCGRSLDEIRKWKSMKRPERMTTLKRADERLKALTSR